MKTILISPYSRRLRNGKNNPKNFPYWADLVKRLKAEGYSVVQVGVAGEPQIDGVDAVKIGLPLKRLAELIKECYAWISVDNFFQHFAYIEGKKGIVIFSQSDPDIFGHSVNKNLLKDRKYLRDRQFDIWESCEYKEEAFVTPIDVVNQIGGLND